MKKNIAVIFGGMSSEHEISLLSAATVIRNLSEDKYNIYPVGITKAGEWFLFEGKATEIENGNWEKGKLSRAFISPDRSYSGLVVIKNGSSDLIKLDCVFPVLHGKNGEDGTIQGLFELSGIPYVGCGTLSSAVCMDKAVTHTLLSAANIEQTHYLWFYADRFAADAENIKRKISARLAFPVFVKPANAGSSVGISKVSDISGIAAAVRLAMKEDSKILVEEGVSGQEVECAVMGNRDAEASCVGEIGASAEFYDYDDKYKNGTSSLFIPARIDEETAEKVRSTAVRAYRLLGCSGLARVDFFVTKDGAVLLNEINTLPGFTSISMYPKLFMHGGLSCSEILDRLVEFAFSK